jgi:hypothetical protein
VTSREQDVEFFELAADGTPLGPDDPFGEGDQPPVSSPISIRARLAALPAQVRAVPNPLKALAALCVLAAAVGGFVLGRASHPAPAAASAPFASSSDAAAPTAASSPDPAIVPVPRRGARPLGVGVTSCRGISDVAVVPIAPANLISAIKAHLPTAIVDTGTSVTNELGTACSSTLAAHMGPVGGANTTVIKLTVTAPPNGYSGNGVSTIVGSGLAQGFEAQFLTPDGWTVDATAEFGPTAALHVALGALVTDPGVIVRAHH